MERMLPRMEGSANFGGLVMRNHARAPMLTPKKTPKTTLDLASRYRPSKMSL